MMSFFLHTFLTHYYYISMSCYHHLQKVTSVMKYQIADPLPVVCQPGEHEDLLSGKYM